MDHLIDVKMELTDRCKEIAEALQDPQSPAGSTSTNNERDDDSQRGDIPPITLTERCKQLAVKLAAEAAAAGARENNNYEESDGPPVEFGGRGCIRTSSYSAAAMHNVLCVVCGDRASGRHYGAISCEGCKGFFKRSIRKQLGYSCRGNNTCEVTKHHRNRCQSCRLQKCVQMGMRSDSVQSERKPMDNGVAPGGKKERKLAPAAREQQQQNKVANQNHNPLINNMSLNLSSIIRAGNQTSAASALAVSSFLSSHNSPTKSSSAAPAAALTLAELLSSRGYHNTAATLLGDNDLTTLSHVVNLLASNGECDLETRVLLAKTIADRVNALQGSSNGGGSGLNQSNSMSETESVNSVQSVDELNGFFEIEGSLLSDEHFGFSVSAPGSPTTPFLTVHYICESASRLLFVCIHWARSINAFQLLPSEVQISLVKNSWYEMFALGLCQLYETLSLSAILTTMIDQLQSSVTSSNADEEDSQQSRHVAQVTDHVCRLQDLVAQMQRLQVDDREYAYMRAACLFSPDQTGNASTVRQVESLQNKVSLELKEYVDQTVPDSPERWGSLLLRLRSLRALQAGVMEEMFFAGLVGNVQIDTVIPYILKMDTSNLAEAAAVAASD